MPSLNVWTAQRAKAVGGVRPDEHWGDPSFAGGRFEDRDWTVRLLPLAHHDARIWAQVPRGPYLGGPEGERSRFRYVASTISTTASTT